VAIVVDATLQGEARVTAKTVLDAAIELAKAEPLPVGVFACQPDGPRVVLGLGDAVAAAVEPCEGRADPGPGARRALETLIAAGSPRGSAIVLLALEDSPDAQRVAADAGQRGFNFIHVPLRDGARAAVALLADEAFGYVAAKGKPASVKPAGGRLAAVSLAPALSVTTWREPQAPITLAAGTELLLYRPAWSFSLETDAPPPIAFVGEAVPVALLVAGPGALGTLLDVSARAPGQTLVLSRAVTNKGLRFEGEAPAPLEEGPCELAFSVAFAAGEARFELDRTFRYVAKKRTGAKPPAVRVEPGKIDLGTVWAGARVPVRLSVRGDAERSVRVSLDESPFARATTLELAPGEEKALSIDVDASRLQGGERLRLVAEVFGTESAPIRPRALGERVTTVMTSQAPPRVLSVPVAVGRVVAAPAAFDLGAVKAGESVKKTFALAGLARASVGGDADLGLAARVENGSLVLEARPAADAHEGARKAPVELALESGATLARDVTLALSVPPPTPVKPPEPELALAVEPKALVLKGRYGWAEARFRASATVAAQLEADPSLLSGSAGRITPRRDIRVRAADGSDARSLPANETRELVLRVYLGSDLAPGRYEGTLALDARAAGKKSGAKLGVTVEVER
jgi:hypothetical protein